MNILVAEDDPTSQLVIRTALTKAGYTVTAKRNGHDAWMAYQESPFEIVITDWMMPVIDGIELVRRIRHSARPSPLIFVVTALGSPAAREHAMRAGADDYIEKPYAPPDLIQRVSRGLARRQQPMPPVPSASSLRVNVHPPFVGVVIAASTGGPVALSELMATFQCETAATFIALHGPAWMLDTFAGTLQRHTSQKVALGREGERATAGSIYIAPGDRHLVVEAGSHVMRVRDDPPENFVRPSADPLFRSAARAFGKYTLGVVMTGLGRDGGLGAADIAAAGGIVLVQSPETCIAESMPRTALGMGIVQRAVPLPDLGAALSRAAASLDTDLQRAR